MRFLPLRWMAQLRRRIIDLLTAPFRLDPTDLLTLSIPQQERRRQRALLRLVIGSIMTLLVVVALPLVIPTQVSSAVLGSIAGIFAVSVICLWLLRRGWVEVAGSVFVIAFLVTVTLSIVFRNPHGLTLESFLSYGYFLLVLPIAGLILPRWGLVLALASSLAITIVTILSLPLSPGILALNEPLAPLRFAAMGIIVSVQVGIALLIWIAAQSVTANAQAAQRALAREHELMRLKDQFIVDANHELRTPIMALYGNIEVLGALGARVTPEQHFRLLTRAKTAGEQVLRQLNSILDAGGAEATVATLTLAPFTLRPLIHEVLTTFDPREIGEPDLTVDADQARVVTLDVAPDLVVLADAGRVRQVLLNLISNALKYSAGGTPITVSADVEVDSPKGRQSRHPMPVSQWVRVSVQDHGLGVPLAEAHHLFQRFVRLERDITGPVRGTGVGLYLMPDLCGSDGGNDHRCQQRRPRRRRNFQFYLTGSPRLVVARTFSRPAT